MRKLIAILIPAVLLSCQHRVVSRVSPDTAMDLSGRWNDTDSKLVAQKMISDLLESSQFKAYADALGHKPAIIVGTIRNKTSEHIDAENYVRRMELAIYESNVADIVESGAFRDRLRKERAEQQDFASTESAAEWGKELGADLMLFGEMLSETDVYNNRRTVNYTTTLFLTDVETNRRVWYGQHEIKKFVKN